MSRTPANPEFVPPAELSGERAQWHQGAVENKARRLVSCGRVSLTEVRPGAVVAFVEGDRASYQVRCSDGTWSCACPSSKDGQRCSHIAAVQLATSNLCHGSS